MLFRSTQALKQFYSEAGLIQYRIRVEVAYLFALTKVLSKVDWSDLLKHKQMLMDWCQNLPESDIERVKTIEKTTNHDVKAVEYCIKEKLDSLGLQAYKEWVHFGLTSQDINNTAIPLSFKEATAAVMIPEEAIYPMGASTYVYRVVDGKEAVSFLIHLWAVALPLLLPAAVDVILPDLN